MYVKKIMFGILLHVIVKMVIMKYLASIVDKIICDEIADVKETNFYEKNRYKVLIFFFLLITITLLIAVNIYCYLIKYRVEQKYLLLFHNTKLKTNQYR